MKPTPLLDLWTPPTGAGDPVALLATTFILDPDFFERDCLARFVAVTSVDEDSGTVSDIVARVELEEKLAETRTTVLADRSTRADRTSLRWDLLHAHVPGGLLHAKVAVLLWSRATRVIIGSANLTAAGYRRQIELAMAADLGPRCILPAAALDALADELRSYLDLLPGNGASHPAGRRAQATIDMFRQRVAAMSRPNTRRSQLFAVLALSGAGRSPFDTFESVWDGPRPRHATHLSPFWDGTDGSVVRRVQRLLTGQGPRSQIVASVLTREGTLPVPMLIRDQVDGTYELAREDHELRTLHAKCLLMQSSRWVAALVGSSNHTRSGMGLNGDASHREVNVWLGADAQSDEGRWLEALIGLGQPVPSETCSAEATDGDEPEELPPSLPLGFALCGLQRQQANGDGTGWRLALHLDPPLLPLEWSVQTPSRRPLLTTADWEATGRPATVIVDLPDSDLPAYLDVAWENNTATWTVVVDDPCSLPPGPDVRSLTVRQLLSALAAGKSISTALRDKLLAQVEQTETEDGPLDPLRRFDDSGSLLRRGRALSAALTQLQLRLERAVLAIDTLEARLSSPLGPNHLADKTYEMAHDGGQSTAEALFMVAEVVLTVGRVDWSRTCAHLTQSDRAQAGEVVRRTLDHLDHVRTFLGPEPKLMADYARRAQEEAYRCLSF